MSIETERLLRRDEVLRLTGLSKSTLNKMVKAGTFPAPVRIGTRAVAWRESEVLEWIQTRQKTC